jgi:peptide subunit release factor 1 (eRF1)
MAELPKHLAEKVVDVVRMDIAAPEHQVLTETLDALRARDAVTDQEHVEAVIGAWRGGGLAVAGPEETLQALEMGQVEELLIAASPAALRHADSIPGTSSNQPVGVETTAPGGGIDPRLLVLADELVTKAHATAARIRFIENAELLAEVGGVGARLRFKI